MMWYVIKYAPFMSWISCRASTVISLYSAWCFECFAPVEDGAWRTALEVASAAADSTFTSLHDQLSLRFRDETNDMCAMYWHENIPYIICTNILYHLQYIVYWVYCMLYTIELYEGSIQVSNIKKSNHNTSIHIRYIRGLKWEVSVPAPREELVGMLPAEFGSRILPLKSHGSTWVSESLGESEFEAENVKKKNQNFKFKISRWGSGHLAITYHIMYFSTMADTAGHLLAMFGMFFGFLRFPVTLKTLEVSMLLSNEVFFILISWHVFSQLQCGHASIHHFEVWCWTVRCGSS